MRTHKRHFNDPNQREFVSFIGGEFGRRFRLAAGDVFKMEGNYCRVLRVNECAAVVKMSRPVREFETRFRGPVKFQPSPKVFRISPNSGCEILNRRHER
jgi:hypothetical protein